MSDHPIGVHLCGSIPLDSSAQVFEAIGGRLGDRLYRLPDGETNDLRQNWAACQIPLFQGENIDLLNPAFGSPARDVQEKELHEYEAMLNNVSPKYDVWAIESYKGFQAAKRAGQIPKHVKFQVCVPTPLAVVTLLVHPGHQRLVEKVYTRKLRECLDRLQAAIPHEDLAIQWDCAVEFAVLEGTAGHGDLFVPYFKDNQEEEVVSRMKELEHWIDTDVEIGFHLCYGDLGHQHFKQPADTTILAKVMEMLLTNSDRKLSFIHIPVPKDRTDTAYLEPLKERALGLLAEQGTTLFVGLVHEDDKAGSQARIEIAKEVFRGTPDLKWGISTECGMGRTPRSKLESILDISVSLSAPVR